MNVLVDGPADAPTVVLLHTICTDHTLWSPMLKHLPETLRIICPDLPGHGLSAPGPSKIGSFISDVEDCLDAQGVTNATIVGHGLGGLIAQGLATKRMDQVRALVLSGTATKLETKERWQRVAREIQSEGSRAFERHIARRWDGPTGTWTMDRDAFTGEGLKRAVAAIAGADFYSTTAALRLPTLVLVGARDAFTPPDLARELADLVPGSRFETLRGAGHLSMLDTPDLYANKLLEFFRGIGDAPEPNPSH